MNINKLSLSPVLKNQEPQYAVQTFVQSTCDECAHARDFLFSWWSKIRALRPTVTPNGFIFLLACLIPIVPAQGGQKNVPDLFQATSAISTVRCLLSWLPRKLN